MRFDLVWFEHFRCGVAWGRMERKMERGNFNYDIYGRAKGDGSIYSGRHSRRLVLFASIILTE